MLSFSKLAFSPLLLIASTIKENFDGSAFQSVVLTLKLVCPQFWKLRNLVMYLRSAPKSRPGQQWMQQNWKKKQFSLCVVCSLDEGLQVFWAKIDAEKVNFFCSPSHCLRERFNVELRLYSDPAVCIPIDIEQFESCGSAVAKETSKVCVCTWNVVYLNSFEIGQPDSGSQAVSHQRFPFYIVDIDFKIETKGALDLLNSYFFRWSFKCDYSCLLIIIFKDKVYKIQLLFNIKIIPQNLLIVFKIKDIYLNVRYLNCRFKRVIILNIDYHI